ncbi:hypothetical protein BKA12_001480 [Neomicrococcus lactis]|uniref:Uncharacterized protein n=1 Tax=Neomicrococcus lactis TaxID=732241 RepID=A0A7W9DB81_9MICC|nr:hypothetical protein [Neomicrococcus lactis]
MKLLLTIIASCLWSAADLIQQAAHEVWLSAAGQVVVNEVIVNEKGKMQKLDARSDAYRGSSSLLGELVESFAFVISECVKDVHQKSWPKHLSASKT